MDFFHLLWRNADKSRAAGQAFTFHLANHRYMLIAASRLAIIACSITGPALAATPGESSPPTILSVGNSRIEVQITGEWPRLQRPAVINWVRRSATSVSTYYGHFPVRKALIKISPFWGKGFHFATTDSEEDTGVISIPVGDVTSQSAMDSDWVLTHEMVHLAFPLVYPKDRWLVEGMATYIEPLARMQAGYVTKEQVWGDLVDGLPKGLPQAGDQGLDGTHSWGRTYWGGALFCLLADIELRKATGNKKGLQDALKAIDSTTGNITSDIEVIDALKAGDQSIGGGKNILQGLYFKMRSSPVTPDLNKIWSDLGVIKQGDTVSFNDAAPLSSVRQAIDSGGSPAWLQTLHIK